MISHVVKYAPNMGSVGTRYGVGWHNVKML